MLPSLDSAASSPEEGASGGLAASTLASSRAGASWLARSASELPASVDPSEEEPGGASESALVPQAFSEARKRTKKNPG
jgi:hypothetical protein